MTIKNRLQRYSLLIRLSAVLLLLFLIPMVIFGISETNARFEEYKSGIDRSCGLLVAQCESSFRENYAVMIQIARTMAQSDIFRYDYISELSIHTHEAVLAMADYRHRANVTRMGIYYGGDVIYTSDGSCRLAVFAANRMNNMQYNLALHEDIVMYSEALRAALDVERDKPALLQLSGSARLVVLLVPVVTNSGQRAIVFYEVTGGGSFRTDQYSALGVSGYAIYSGDNGLVYASGDIGGILDTDEVRSFLMSRGQYMTQNNEEPFTLYQVYNQMLDLHFLIMTRPMQTNSSMQNLLAMLTRTVVFAIVLFTLISAIIIYLSYKPLRTLMNKMRSLGIEADGRHTGNEMTTILSGIDRLYTVNEELRTSAALQRDIIVMHMLDSLLQGHPVSDKLLQRYGVILSSGLCVLLASVQDSRRERIQDVCTPMLKRGYRVYSTDMDESEYAVFIASLPSGRDLLGDCASALLGILTEQFGQKTRVCAGAFVEKPGDLSKSYLTARFAMKQSDMQLCLFDEAGFELPTDSAAGQMLHTRQNDCEEDAQFRRYVEEHLRDSDFNLSTLAAALNLPSYTASRIFHRLFGMAYSEYVTVHRIELAKEELLLHPEMSIRNVAFSVGFSDPSYFNRVFKSVCGITPRQFRDI